jgi:hypothetical protein
MATSSIFANVVIDDPKKAEAFIDAYVEAMENPKRKSYLGNNSLVTDPDEIRRILSKGEKSK